MSRPIVFRSGRIEKQRQIINLRLLRTTEILLLLCNSLVPVIVLQ